MGPPSHAAVGAWDGGAVSASSSEPQETANTNRSVDTANAAAIEVILMLPPS